MKRRAAIGLILATSVSAFVTCDKNETAPSPVPGPAAGSSTVTDSEGNVYRTITIGTQTWMAENLRTRRGAGGGALSGVFAYGDLESNVATYGRLYLWNTATMPLIAGWHLPSYAEWTRLIGTVGVANAGALLRQGGSSGFDALFGGYRDYGGGYHGLGTWSQYWTSTVMDVVPADHAHTITFHQDRPEVESTTGAGFIGGHSVRLVRD